MQFFIKLLAVTLLDFVEVLIKDVCPFLYFFAVKLSSLYFFSILPLMMLQIDFFLLNAVAFISLDKTSSCKSFLAIFLQDLELILSFASC